MAPSYADIQKASNDLLGKDFFHLSTASVDVKSTAPNGVTFTVKGKTAKDNSIAASVEAKYVDKATGLTLTEGWNNANNLSTKIELSELLTPGLKGELDTSLVPNGTRNAKLNFFYQQSAVNARFFFDLLKGPIATADLAVNHDGFTAGAELGYDISSAKVNKYSAGLGYASPVYSVSVTGTSNLSVYTAAYYHKVSPFVEAGAKVAWDSVKSNGVAVEFATKYVLDKSAFVKAKIADSGLAALAYSQELTPGVKLGLGVGFNALKLAEPVHQLGFSLSFAA
ncbi:Mitochondrial porin [Scheffersomyces spartinae]|uniref:Mitochondrial porin n=1 Tax=Scheffersomyces spartinae TaxID=45513 RepID=A0A9P8AH85_9ASCO|nr:Mitochondrial porin [Scheffersomyces spartinae]KAG7193061.1 Mitochondrial porin [Scheffersomyces spartinae]